MPPVVQWWPLCDDLKNKEKQMERDVSGGFDHRIPYQEIKLDLFSQAFISE